MRKLKLTVQYRGTDFFGWQDQPLRPNIQRTLKEAFQKITGEAVSIVGSGRTDAGVHALAQVAHLKTVSQHPTDRLKKALNGVLPDSISVVDISEVSLNFHAQRSALSKRYTYLIWNHPVPSVFFEPYSWQIHLPLDWKKMEEASRFLIGEHDFKSFQSAGTEVNSTVRTIHSIEIQNKIDLEPLLGGLLPNYPALFSISFEGNGFLKQMVRNIVGTLVNVGRNYWPVHQVRTILEAKDRKIAGPAAPAKGLFLVRVHYGATPLET